MVSRRRRQLHDRIGFLRASGGQDADTLARLARLEVEEREVSRRRHELHGRIDVLRAQDGRAGAPPGAPKKEKLLEILHASAYAQSMHAGSGPLPKTDE